MEDFSRYLGITRTLALVCCVFYTSLQADGNSISYTSGSRVTLHCNKTSINCLIQLAWKKDGENLFSFLSQRNSNSSCETSNNSQKSSDSKLQKSPLAASLELNMSTLESKLYALIIESAQKTHTGNYTCETITDTAVSEQKWELIITEEAGNPSKTYSAAAISVRCVCVLIFIMTLVIPIRVCKRRSENSTQSAKGTSGGHSQHVYENSLELEAHQQSGQVQVHPQSAE